MNGAVAMAAGAMAVAFLLSRQVAISVPGPVSLTC